MKTERGFTLIELVVTVAIIAVLASGLFPLVEISAKRAKEQELRSALREIRTAIDAYKQAVDEGKLAKDATKPGYPPSLQDLVNGVTDQRSPTGQQIYFLRRLPRDPFAAESKATAEETWGQRSYASPPDAPAPGVDVFDIYSLSSLKGLNGVPYKEW
ncbi:MAG: prepilin-type N-terminal cleavage/methylation domain-containing protein [Burkholderiales bacterium]